jgi:regulator of sigma E protease
MIFLILQVLLVTIVFLVIISFLVIIHELGHYLTAKFFKVRVEEFGLGYPPRAKTLFTYAGTIFSLNWIPFGGFVKMEGEDGMEPEVLDVAETKKKTPTKKTTKDDVGPFYEKSKIARLIIILAGATVNFLFGILVFSFYFSVRGIPVPANNPRIGEVAPNSPAAQSQIPSNVDILGIKVKEKLTQIHNPENAIAIISQHPGETVTVITTGPCKEEKCDPTPHEYSVYLRKKEETPTGQGSLGIRFEQSIHFQFYPWYEMPFRGAWLGVQQSLNLSFFILTLLRDIVVNLTHGHVSQDVSGPVGIVYQLHKTEVLNQGFWKVLEFTGMLSINLAVMNVLPIPALDGGRAFFILIETFTGKKKIEKFENSANSIGFVFLIVLMVMITFKDILNIVVEVMKKGH